VADSEVKAGTLQLTVERLNGALAKVEESEGGLRVKVQGLTEALAQSNASLTSIQDKNLHLQKALTACEHDRQVLQVWGSQGVSGEAQLIEQTRRGLVKSQPMGLQLGILRGQSTRVGLEGGVGHWSSQSGGWGWGGVHPMREGSY
jgi:rootletin